MTTYTPFGTDMNLGTALRTFRGIPNRRAWEAFCFPIHPCHDSSRDQMGIARGFTVTVYKERTP